MRAATFALRTADLAVMGSVTTLTIALAAGLTAKLAAAVTGVSFGART